MASKMQLKICDNENILFSDNTESSPRNPLKRAEHFAADTFLYKLRQFKRS